MQGPVQDTTLSPPPSGSSAPAEAARRRLMRAARRGTGSGFTTLLPVLAVAVPASVLALGGMLTWDAVVNEARTEVRRIADAGAATAERTLNSHAVTARRINDGLATLDPEAPGYRRRAHEILAAQVAGFSPPVISFAIDAAGAPLAASHMHPVPADQSLADRDFYQALSRPDAPELHLSRMFTGRFDDRLYVALSRGRWTRAGPDAPAAFAGLVTISIDPNTIGAGLRRLLPRDSDTLALLRADGAPIAVSRPHDQPLAESPRDAAFDALVQGGAANGQYWSLPQADGERSLVAVQRLDGFPAYAVASRSLGAVRAEWRAMYGPYLAFGVAAIAGLLALSLRVRRDQMRLVAANASLQRDVAQSQDRLDRARRYALVGAFEVDLRDGSSLRSPEYMALHGLAPGATSETHENWLRRLHPDDRASAEAALLRAIADDHAGTDYAQTYRTVTPAGDVRWISARGEVERDARGRAVLLRGVHVDVTSLRSVEGALAESDARLVLAQDAVGIGAWEWQPATGRLHLSARAQELLGIGATPTRRDALRRVVPQDRTALREALRGARDSGALSVELRLAGSTSAWVMVRARQLDLADGKGRRLIGVAYDITRRKESEARAAMLAREVEHRARNAMTLVSGLVRMTSGESHEAFVESLEGRIRSLAQTITLLGRSRWSGASIEALAREELAPFLDGAADAVRIAGPEVKLGPDAAQQLSMALHELTTNSAKYGALSSPQGRLSIEWRVQGASVAISWTESGGPAVPGVPDREGFGSYLIRSTIEGQLGGTLVMHWEPGGLRCEITVPTGEG